MVLHLAVENAVPSTFEGDKGMVTMIQVVMTDKTKPAVFRAQTRFVCNMMPDQFRKYWDTLEIEDEKVTVLAKDLIGKGAVIKVKGDLIKGWADAQQIEALARTISVLPPTTAETAAILAAAQASPTESQVPASKTAKAQQKEAA